MALRLIVKVNSVNNLTDARYCAGMGVEMLGICTDPDSADFVSPDKSNAIAGWISGVKIVGEISRRDDSLLKNYSFDIIESENFNLLQELSEANVPLIYKVDITEEFDLQKFQTQASLLSKQIIFFSVAIKDKKFAQFLSQSDFSDKILIDLNESTIELEDVDKLKFGGITLKGGNEIRPGLKNFDGLQDILELLEIEE